MTSPLVRSRSHVQNSRRRSLDVDRTLLDPNKGSESESPEENLLSIQDLGRGDKREALRKQPTHPSDRNSQHRAHLEGDGRKRRQPTHRRDRSAPPSYDSAHLQRYGPASTAAGPDYELPKNGYASSSPSRRLPLEPSSRSTMADPNHCPIPSEQDDSSSRLPLLAMVSSSTPTDEASPAPFAPLPTPAQMAATNTTVRATQCVAADGVLVASPAEHQVIGHPGACASRNTPSACPACFDTSTKAKDDLDEACRDFQLILDEQDYKIAGLEDKNRTLQKKNTDLKHALESQQQESKDLTARVEDLQDMMASKVVAPNSNPGIGLIGDADVQARWNYLCFSIRQVVTDHVDASGKRGSSISALRDLTGAYEVLLRDKDGCCLLAQAIIWRVLAEHVFGNGARMSRMFWAGKFSESLRCLCRCLSRPDD